MRAIRSRYNPYLQTRNRVEQVCKKYDNKYVCKYKYCNYFLLVMKQFLFMEGLLVYYILI